MLTFSLFLECDNREQVHSVQQAAILILEHSLPWPDLSQTIESQTVFDDLEVGTCFSKMNDILKYRKLFILV